MASPAIVLSGFPRAEGTTTDHVPVEPASFVFDGVVPRSLGKDAQLGGLVKTFRRYYSGEARRFLDALYRVAPGGFVDALFGELAHDKASIFRVAKDSE